MSSEQIVTLTMNPTVDINSTVDNVVADRKLRCEPSHYEPGGGGINVSRAIRRLGGNSLALYTAGGMFGRMLEELLDPEGIAHRSIGIGGSTRESVTISERSRDRQFRFVMPGPQLDETEWRRCLAILGELDPKPAYVVASGSLPGGVPGDFYAELAHRSLGLGAKVIVDTSGEALRSASRAGVYLLKPNINEIQDLIGRRFQDESELVKAAQELIEKGGTEVIVVSLGAAGALTVSGEGYEFVRAPTVPIRSRVGAGDSTVAGIALGLATGKPLREAVRFGVAAGAAAVMTPGTELCRREDAERLYLEITTTQRA
jgi:6-phosphofructokinase 2